MDNIQISSLLKRTSCLRHVFKGVYSRDTLPTLSPCQHYPFGLIVNTDKKDEPGEHWLAIWAPSQDKAIFFDSFGKPALFYGIEIDQFLTDNFTEPYGFNNIQLQHSTSDMCGMFCIFFLFYMCKGLSMREIVTKFEYPKHLLENGLLLRRFAARNLPKPIDMPDGVILKRQHSLPMYKIIRMTN